MINAVNSDGATWLEILVVRGDSRSLDVALSPKYDLSWQFRLPYLLDWVRLSSLRDCAQKQGDPIIQLIIETFEQSCIMKQIYDRISNCFRETENELLADDSMALLQNDDAEMNAARFVRFINDWNGTSHFHSNVWSKLVRNGHHQLLKLFYSAEKSWFWTGEDCIHSNYDDGTYIEPELSSEGHEKLLEADFITICMIGESTFNIGARTISKLNYFDGLK